MTNSMTDTESDVSGCLCIEDEQLVEMARDLFESMFGMQVQQKQGAAPESQCEGIRWTAEVRIVREQDIRVRVIVPEELAFTITSTMFDLARDELTSAEVSDSIGEVVNIIGGVVKGLDERATGLSLPCVGTGVGVPSDPKSMVALECDGETFFVMIL